MGNVNYYSVVKYGKWNGKIGFDISQMNKISRTGKAKRIFIGSMSDIGHPNVTYDMAKAVWDECSMINFDRQSLYPDRDNHTFIFLTKRPKRMAALWNLYCKDVDKELMGAGLINGFPIGLGNSFFGVTAENQEQWDKRLSHLLWGNFPNTFVSVEPLLGAIDTELELNKEVDNIGASTLDWVIVGGETGPGARPMDPEWVHQIKDDCKRNNVPFFFKKWGGKNKSGLIDGVEYREFPKGEGK
jgi:protein gp37